MILIGLMSKRGRTRFMAAVDPRGRGGQHMEMASIKACMRNEARAAACMLTREYMDAAGNAIERHILALEPYASANAVFCYVSVEHEVDTHTLIQRALGDGKRVCVPRCASKGDMRPIWIAGLHELTPGAYGIPEPPLDNGEASPHQIDLAVIPCVCCTHTGERLGHGGGYYDRFLAGFSGIALMICFERLIRDTIPMEAHDRAVDIVITEQGVWKHGRRIDQ